MGTRPAVAAERLALSHANHATEWPQSQAAPRWMTWVPVAAIAWALGYGAVRIWWAIGDSPSPVGTDLIAFTGWRAVGLCAAAAGVILALRKAPWRWPLLIAAWGVSAALLAASAKLLLDVVGALFPGNGIAVHPAAFVSRTASLGGAVLVGAAAVAYRRRWRSACLFCGRTGISVRPARPPRWAWWAAYAAVAGCLVRLGAQAAVGFDMQGGGSLLMFEAGFLLAGTALPLALVHRWGRVLPRWVPTLAGRRVPRWLLLWPAFGIAGGMTAYFGVALVQLAAETLSGTWDRAADDLPLAFFWVAVPAVPDMGPWAGGGCDRLQRARARRRSRCQPPSNGRHSSCVLTFPQGARDTVLRKALLTSGIAASLFYVAANVFGALRWDAYSSVNWSISELFAVDAPSRPTFLAFGIPYGLLSLTFGIGVLWAVRDNRRLRMTGWFLVAVGVLINSVRGCRGCRPSPLSRRSSRT
jgi:hypothetical protein